MSIKYALVQRGKPGDPTAPKKFYAIPQNQGEVSLRELSNEIAEISTVSVIDTMAVLESLLQIIPRHIKSSEIVRLGDLGSFVITLQGDGSDTESAYSPTLIKRIKVQFKPGKIFKQELKTASFEKA